MLLSSPQIFLCCAVLFLILKLTSYIDSSVFLKSIVYSETFTKVFPIKDLFWRKFFLSCLIVVIPSYILANPAFIFQIKSTIMSYFKNSKGSNYDGQSSSFSRSFLNRRRLRTKLNLTEEELQHVLKRGGNIGGLINDGNTCFMNSVLQSLASSNTIVDFLEHEDVSKKELIFTKAFKTLLGDLNGKHYTKNHDYKTDPLLRTMTKTPNKSFLMGYNQEDAQEFFQTILSELESDYKKIHSLPSSSNSKIESFYNKDLPQDSIFGSDKLGQLGDVFVPAQQIDPNLPDSSEKSFKYNLLTPLDGLSAERIGCLHCGEMGGIRYSLISGLSLNLPPDNYTALKLTDLLKEWIKPEIIEGVDCYRCALTNILEYQTKSLNSLKDKHAISEDSKKTALDKLIGLTEDRIKVLAKELEKPIIDEESYKKLHTDNMVQKSSKSKQILISRPPPLLSIHINRSVFDPVTYRVRKNNARVIFPLKLDLDQFVAESSEINTDARLPLSKKVFPEESDDESDEQELEKKSYQQEEVDSDESDEPEGKLSLSSDEEDVLTPESNDVSSAEEVPSSTKAAVSDLEDDEDEEEEGELPKQSLLPFPTSIEKKDVTGPLVYQLRSVVVHYGSHNYGHYIAFRKYRGVWWRTSDETIDIVDEDEVLSTPGVFMLFYELDSLSEQLKKDDQEIEIMTGDYKEGEEDEDDQELYSAKEEEDESTTVNNHAMAIANL